MANDVVLTLRFVIASDLVEVNAMCSCMCIFLSGYRYVYLMSICQTSEFLPR